MAKRKPRDEIDDTQPEYDFSGGVRGKYFERYQSMRQKVHLDPDTAQLFPDSQAVNEALRTLARLVSDPKKRTARRRRAG